MTPKLSVIQVEASDPGQRPVAGSCEYGNEALSSVKGGDFWTS
jgi:hypothetical protein